MRNADPPEGNADKITLCEVHSKKLNVDLTYSSTGLYNYYYVYLYVAMPVHKVYILYIG